MKNVISNFRAEVEKIINENPLHKDEINDIIDEKIFKLKLIIDNSDD